MLTTLTDLCQELRNWFDLERYSGTFEITGGSLTASFLVTGQYYRIIGSLFNDGVHKYGDETDQLTDESFEGSVWSMAVPPAVIALATQIEAWRTKYENIDSPSMSPFMQESFDGYSYTKGSAFTGNASSAGWPSAFSSALNRWRKL